MTFSYIHNEVFYLQVGFCAVKPLDGVTYLSAQATGTVVIP